MNDLRFAFRQLLRNPGSATVAVLTLALGIGLNAAIFNLGRALLVRPVPGVSHPDRLVQIGRTDNGEGFRSLSYADFRDFKAQVKALDLAALWDGAFEFEEGAWVEHVRGAVVSGNYFNLLGVRMAAGRPLLPRDDTAPGAHPVAVISYRLWQQVFAGEPKAVGRTVRLNGADFTVVGVVGPEFKGTERQRALDVWVPMAMLAEAAPGLGNARQLLSDRATGWHGAIGRLRPGFTLAEAGAELAAVARRLARLFPESNAGRGVAVVSGTSAYQRDRKATRSELTLLLALAGLVLAGACASVTNAQLARAIARRREMRIRVALGAGRGRLLRQSLTENLLLAGIAGVLAWVLAVWTSRLFVVLLPADLELGTLRLHPGARVFILGVALALSSGITSAIASWWWLARRDPACALRESATRGLCTRAPLRNALVVGQVALAMALLVTVGLLGRSLQQVLRRHEGPALKSVLVASLDVGELGYTPARGRQTIETLRRRALGLAGVATAGFVSIRPFHQEEADATARNTGMTERQGLPVGEAIVTPGLFESLGIPLSEGRDFDAHDRSSTRPVAIVNEATANRLWPGRSALGRRLIVAGKTGRRAFEVVGVVADARLGAVTGAGVPEVYLPFAQHYQSRMVLAVRAKGRARPLIGAARAAFAAAAPGLPPVAVRTLDEELAFMLEPERATASVVSIFAALALVLATTAIYGLVMWSVVQRTFEFGVRMALGARPADIVGLVMRGAGRLLMAGLGVGALLSLALTALLRSRLIGVSFADPVTYGCVLALLGAVGCGAAYLPARRAANLDPMEALRYE